MKMLLLNLNISVLICFLYYNIGHVETVSIFCEQSISATEFEKFDWVITFVTIQEQVSAMNLYRKYNETSQKVMLTYEMDQVTSRQYHNGFSSKEVVIQVDDEALRRLSDPNNAVNAYTTGIIYHFVNPKLSDSGTYLFELRGQRIDSKKQFILTREVTVEVKEPSSANMVEIPAAGRIGFPLDLPCSLIGESSRSNSFTAVFWRKGPFLSSSKLITQWKKFREEPEFPDSGMPDEVDRRVSFREQSSESVFELSLDATLRVSSLQREDFDNWWCEIEFNQDETVVVYKVSVVADSSPTFNGTTTDNRKESLFDNLGIIFEPPYLYYFIATIAGLIFVILLTCCFIYCILGPSERKRRKRNSRRDTQMYPVAHKMSHVSIVPCELCQENAIDCFAMPCGHTYCEECLDNQIAGASVCVFCRKAIDRKQRLYNKIVNNEFL